MKLSQINESNGPDFEKAIGSFILKLNKQGYKLISHIWDDGTGNCFEGYFIAKHPDKLETYKLRDFKTPDAYHLGRSYIEEVDWGGFEIDSKYEKIASELKNKFPDFDQYLYLDGDVSVPNDPEVLEYLEQNSVPYKISAEQIHPQMVADNSKRHTHEIGINAFLSALSNTNLQVIAKRLYNIIYENADRWVEYRIDTGSHKSFWDNFNKELNKEEDPEDPADWWKKSSI